MCDEDLDECLELLHALHAHLAEVEPQIEGDLVVPGTTRVQFPRHGSDDLSEPPLDGRVHVLVAVVPGERATRRIGSDLFQATGQGSDLVARENPHLTEHRHVRQ